MLSSGTILTVALRITAVSSVTEFPFENWFCGTDTMTRMISYNSMMLDGGGSCWKYAARVNHCCAIHDNCYGLQLGRENCDQNFCDCLLRATAPDTCVATALKCLATIEGGEEAYLNSATYQEQLDFVKIVPNIDGIEKEFLLLYQECPLVMETIKSCSLLTNICINNEEENCEHRLSECVQQAADLQNSQQCREATHQAQQSLKSKTIHRTVIDTKSTKTIAEDETLATSTRASPRIITTEHHNQHDPSASSLGVSFLQNKV
uniref:Phospholipase A2 n=1 Tax=Haemonchus contortus TaxID=6289 RepID=A0A7I4YGH8_HAECO